MMTNPRIINHIALPVLLVAAVLNIYWVWGLLFFWWLVPAITTGQTFLVFMIEREKDPILYWATIILWGLFGVMLIAASLFPSHAIWLV